MPSRRRPSKHTRPVRPLDLGRHPTRTHTSRGAFLVREVPADQAVKDYVCPGCNTSVPAGSAHVVAWPEVPSLGFTSGLDERRHWHTHCWRIHR